MRIARVFRTGTVSNPCLARSVVCALFGVIAVLVSSSAFAASISYGDFGPIPPSGAMFLDVEESSGTDPVPLYGPPTPFNLGLDFDPTFVSQSAGGGVDFTDGQLNFTIMSQVGITNVFLNERGDYSLIGAGTAATQALAGAILQATVTQINGANVAPINLAPVNASVGFNLLANPGMTQPWSLGLGLNVAGQLQPGQNATKVEIVINNQLATLSQTGSGAFIAKKDFRIGVGLVPEPTTIGLAGLALCSLLTAGRRRVF